METNRTLANKDEVICNCREIMGLLFNATGPVVEQATLFEEQQRISDMVR